MELRDILSIISLSVSAMALISVWLGYKRYNDDKNNPDINRKRFYWDFFIPEYLDGSFTYRNKKIEFKDGRQKIKRDYGNLSDENAYKKYVEASRNERKPSYENKFAHRLSVSLNRIGQATFVGDLPLYYVLSISSKMILDDWEKSKALINTNILDYSAVGYNRKVFRWLALASCMYLISHDISHDSTEALDKAKRYLTQLIFLDDRPEKIDKKFYEAIADAIVEEIENLQKSDDKIIGELVLAGMDELKETFKEKWKLVVSMGTDTQCNTCGEK